MKKNAIFLSAFLVSAFAFSQVGVNTPDPKATFDITAKAPTGTISTAEGLLVPRVDRERAQSMTNILGSTLIYVNDVSTGTQTGTAMHIDGIGYYYFNGVVWVKLHNPSNIPVNGNNIYNTNGTLTASRIVTQGAYALTFYNRIINGFSVINPQLGYTFSVDGQNNKVGIGTATPLGRLHVYGTGAGTTPLLALTNNNVGGTPTLKIYPGYASNGVGIVSGYQTAVVFDTDPGGSTIGANQSLYDFHGQVRYVNAGTLSDRKLKENIRDLHEYGLTQVMRMQPRRYTLKEYKTEDIGVIAQELKAIIPEIVYADEKGLLSVDYSKISLVLINAIKEQQKNIEELKTEITNLKEKAN